MNLSYFSQIDFYQSLKQFFGDLNIPLNLVTEAPGNPQDIISTAFNPNNEAHKLMDDVYFFRYGFRRGIHETKRSQIHRCRQGYQNQRLRLYASVSSVKRVVAAETVGLD